MKTRNRSLYAQRIAEALARRGYILQPDQVEQVEAWMRLECNTLDGLSAQQFADEVLTAYRMVTTYPDDSAALARTYFP